MGYQHQVQLRDLKEEQYIHSLLQLTLSPGNACEAVSYVGSLASDQRSQFLEMANSHHVILRALQPVLQQATLAGNTERAAWVAAVIEKENARISTAVRYLHEICAEVEAAGCPATVDR